MEKHAPISSIIGWKATAGSEDRNELIREFQSALKDEISVLKHDKKRRNFFIYDGVCVDSVGGLYNYRFPRSQIDEPSRWLRNQKPLALTIEGETFEGIVVSSNKESMTIGLEVDQGELIEEASIEDTAFRLLENLVSKLNKIMSGEISFNFEGSMKLFGLRQPTNLCSIIPSEGFEDKEYIPNAEQKIAILTALRQEVTFIWGPPGTGKTKTLTTILNKLIKAGKRVLLASNTHAAVDEILKKFINNKKNSSIIEEGKIIRLGVPTVQDGSFDCLLVEKIVERKTVEAARQIKDIETQIASNQEIISKYERMVETVFTAKRVMETNVPEQNELEKKVQALQDRVAQVKADIKRNHNVAKRKRQHLDKALSAGSLRRIFSGKNIGKIKTEIKTIDYERGILNLKLESLNGQLDEVREQQTALSKKMSELRDASEVKLDEKTTIESLQQRIREMRREVETKKNELNSIWLNLQKVKDGIFNNALVIGSTIARACLDSKIVNRKFDVLIVDEASMASLPSLFFLAGLCSSHYVISGDFRQLSPIFASQSGVARRWLGRDIFTQAGIIESVESDIDDQRLVMLREQYRMHPAICGLVSDAVYCGKLKTPEDVAKSKEELARLSPFEGEALIFCDTATVNPHVTHPRNSYSRISPYSATISTRIALKCLEEGQKNDLELNVGIITPYREQVKLISKMLDDKNADRARVVVSTIHRFQGSEKDVIVFDLVEGNPLYPGKLIKGEFKKTEAGRLVTVAISRAMGKFILVGNSQYVKSRFLVSDALTQTLARMHQTGKVVDSCIIEDWSFKEGCDASRIEVLKDSSFYILDQNSFYETFIKDLKKAKARVIIFSPFISEKRVSTLLDHFESVLKNGVSIYIVTRDPKYLFSNKAEVVKSLQDLTRIGCEVIFDLEVGVDTKFHYKMAIIDNKVVYFGSLNILSQVNSAEKMMVFRSKKTVAQLARTFGISAIIKNENTSQQEVSILRFTKPFEISKRKF